MSKPDSSSIVPIERIENAFLFIRGHKVILDAELARLYGVSAKRLNEAVRRNRDRFPADFIFQLTREEIEELTRQIDSSNLRSQFATSSWGGRRYLPYAFTEQGVAMLSTVLRSKRAIQVNVEIMRAFVRLRRMLASNEELPRSMPRGRSLFATGIRQRCIFGGRGDRWLRAEQCCLGFCCLILAMNSARKSSNKKFASFCQRCKDKSAPRMRTFENLFSSSLVISPIGSSRPNALA